MKATIHFGREEVPSEITTVQFSGDASEPQGFVQIFQKMVDLAGYDQSQVVASLLARFDSVEKMDALVAALAAEQVTLLDDSIGHRLGPA